MDVNKFDVNRCKGLKWTIDGLTSRRANARSPSHSRQTLSRSGDAPMPLTDMHDGLLSAHSVFPSQVYRDQAWQIWDRISSPATGGTNRRDGMHRSFDRKNHNVIGHATIDMRDFMVQHMHDILGVVLPACCDVMRVLVWREQQNYWCKNNHK